MNVMKMKKEFYRLDYYRSKGWKWNGHDILELLVTFSTIKAEEYVNSQLFELRNDIKTTYAVDWNEIYEEKLNEIANSLIVKFEGYIDENSKIQIN